MGDWGDWELFNVVCNDTEPPEPGDEYDCDMIDAPDGSNEWEVRAHPYDGVTIDDINECWFDAGYLAALGRDE
jgi:hypothetical protein